MARHSTIWMTLLLAACDGGTSNTGTDSGIDAATNDAGVDAAPRPDTGPPDGGPAFPDDPQSPDRALCHFAAGAHVADTLPADAVTAARTAITHVIVIVQENRSFDHMFGTLGGDTEGIPSGYSEPDSTGAAVTPFHLTPTCQPDIGHGWTPTHTAWNNGAMDGWVRVNGHEAIGYTDDTDHPFYSWMARTFAISDRYFCSVLGPTHPNRDYLYLGTSDGIRESYAGYATSPTLFDQLDTASVQWAEYNASTAEVFSGTFPSTFRGVRSYDQFLPDLMNGTIPPVSFVDLEPNDEHPPGTVHDGEIAMHPLIAQAFNSPLWQHLAILFTYDEGGGFFDHVPPPTACLAAPDQAAFDHLGVRVPFILISPYARGGFVSHRVHSHTSILRFIQALFDLPALTGRDANSDALFDLFDFSTPTFMTPPTGMPDAAARDC